MASLVFLKSLSLFFHGVNYMKIASNGYHIETWAVLYYITHLLKVGVVVVVVNHCTTNSPQRLPQSTSEPFSVIFFLPSPSYFSSFFCPLPSIFLSFSFAFFLHFPLFPTSNLLAPLPCIFMYPSPSILP